MADKTKIEWSDFTLNFLVGCTKVSAGCDNCYAIDVSHGLERRFKSEKYTGLTILENGKLNWTGKIKLIPELIEKPLHMTKPRKIFVNSMSDLFHEQILTDNKLWNAVWKFFGVMLKATQHEYQILTKRPHIMRNFVLEYLKQNGLTELPKHIWLGTSVESQKVYETRVPKLLEIPGATKWLSCEPLIANIMFPKIDEARDKYLQETQLNKKLDWVVIGGESGANARKMEMIWLDNLLSFCLYAKIPVFVKQLGSVLAKELKYKHSKGGDIDEWTYRWKVRQYPNAIQLFPSPTKEILR